MWNCDLPHPVRCAGPFDFSRALWLLCHDICERMPEFSHIGMDRVAVTFAQARRPVSWGLQAKLTPLRFRSGALTTRRGGRDWQVQRVFHGNREMLYILTFYLPRFLETPFEEKLTTVFHELYHIGPDFDGDIRRMNGRYHVHSHSQKQFDAGMAELARRWLSLRPPADVYEFLHSGFDALHQRFGGVMGLQIPIPKLIPRDEQRSA